LPGAGHLLIVNRDGSTNLKQYWDAAAADRDEHSPPKRSTVKKYCVLLRDSIRKRMMSDVPFGVFSFPAGRGFVGQRCFDVGTDGAAGAKLTLWVSPPPMNSTNSIGRAGAISKRLCYRSPRSESSGKRRCSSFCRSLFYHQDEGRWRISVCVPLYLRVKAGRARVGHDRGAGLAKALTKIFAGYDWFQKILCASTISFGSTRKSCRLALRQSLTLARQSR